MKKYLLFLVFLGLTFLYYHKTLSSYFEGDEWFYFSEYFPLLINPFLGFFVAITKGVTDAYWISAGGHVTPLQSLLWFFLIVFFKLNFKFYAVSSLVLHAVNVFLLYALTKQIIKDKFFAFCVAAFFLTNSAHFQAVNWAMVIVYDLFLTTLILLSLLSLLKFGKNQRWVVISTVCFVSALMIKETAAILFIIYPLFSAFFKAKYFKKSLFVTAAIFVSYVPFRFILPRFFSEGKLFQNNLEIGIKTLQDFQLIVTNMFVQDIYPSTLGLIKIHPMNMVVVAALILGMVLFNRQYMGARIVVFGIAITLLNASLILLTSLFSPRQLSFEIVDSRYLYLVSISVSLIIIGIYVIIIEGLAIKTKLRYVPLSLLVFLMAIFNYNLLQRILTPYVETAKMRQDILNSIFDEVKTPSDRSIFLVESSGNYYGFAQIPPFQTNLGQVLAVHYFSSGNLNKRFINDRSVQKNPLDKNWLLVDGNKSFGYYLSREQLIQDALKFNISPQTVHAYTWEPEEKKLERNTEKFIPELELELSQRQQLREWKKVHLDSFSFKIDPSYSETHLGQDSVVLGHNETITVKRMTKDPSIFFHDFAPSIFDSNGDKILDRTKLLNITKENGELVTTLYVLSGNYPMYLIPISDGISYIEISANGNRFYRDVDSLDEEKRNSFIELIIKSIILKSS